MCTRHLIILRLYLFKKLVLLYCNCSKLPCKDKKLTYELSARLKTKIALEHCSKFSYRKFGWIWIGQHNCSTFVQRCQSKNCSPLLKLLFAKNRWKIVNLFCLYLTRFLEGFKQLEKMLQQLFLRMTLIYDTWYWKNRNFEFLVCLVARQTKYFFVSFSIDES